MSITQSQTLKVLESRTVRRAATAQRTPRTPRNWQKLKNERQEDEQSHDASEYNDDESGSIALEKKTFAWPRSGVANYKSDKSGQTESSQGPSGASRDLGNGVCAHHAVRDLPTAPGSSSLVVRPASSSQLPVTTSQGKFPAASVSLVELDPRRGLSLHWVCRGVQGFERTNWRCV